MTDEQLYSTYYMAAMQGLIQIPGNHNAALLAADATDLAERMFKNHRAKFPPQPHSNLDEAELDKMRTALGRIAYANLTGAEPFELLAQLQEWAREGLLPNVVYTHGAHKKAQEAEIVLVRGKEILPNFFESEASWRIPDGLRAWLLKVLKLVQPDPNQ